MRPTEKDVLSWDPTIATLAKKRSRMIGVDFDDLYQEGRLSVITSYMMDESPSEQSITNALRRYVRAVKESREVVYEPEISQLLPIFNS